MCKSKGQRKGLALFKDFVKPFFKRKIIDEL